MLVHCNIPGQYCFYERLFRGLVGEFTVIFLVNIAMIDYVEVW